MSYDSTILAEPSLVYFWKLNETTGTSAADSKGTDTGTYEGTGGTNYTLGQTGIGDGETAVLFDGTAGWVQTATSITAPASPFSVECWFKTTSANGGGLIGFDNAQGTSGVTTNDRCLWIDNTGNLVWDIYDGNVHRQLVSTAAYNDGNWHYVVAMIGASGMALYVDGASVATNAITTTFSYTGYWHVAWVPASGLTNAPTIFYLAGDLAKVAVYSSALTSTQVTNHYNAASSSTNATVSAPSAQIRLRSASPAVLSTSSALSGRSAQIRLRSGSPTVATGSSATVTATSGQLRLRASVPTVTTTSGASISAPAAQLRVRAGAPTIASTSTISGTSAQIRLRAFGGTVGTAAQPPAICYPTTLTLHGYSSSLSVDAYDSSLAVDAVTSTLTVEPYVSSVTIETCYE